MPIEYMREIDVYFGSKLFRYLLLILISVGCVQCSNKTKHYTDVPDIKGKMLNGDSVSLREIARDKVTLLNVWGVFCGPCMKELPILHDIYDRYKSEENFMFITVAMDSEPELSRFLNPADTTEYRKMFKYSQLTSFYLPTIACLPHGYSKYLNGFAIVRDSTECRTIQKKIRSNAVPTSLIFDRKGKLVFKQIGSFEDTQLLTGMVDSLLSY